MVPEEVLLPHVVPEEVLLPLIKVAEEVLLPHIVVPEEVLLPHIVVPQEALLPPIVVPYCSYPGCLAGYGWLWLMDEHTDDGKNSNVFYVSFSK